MDLDSMAMITPGVIAAIAYGLLAIGGGLMGYLKAQSTVSLISGGLSGLLLIISGILQLQGQPWGLIIAAALTGILVITFIVRLIKTRKFMPAGLMVILGIVVFAVLLNQMIAIV